MKHRKTLFLVLLAAFAASLLCGLEGLAQQGIPDFDRGSWGRWLDADGDCYDTRAAALRDGSDPAALVARRTGKVCRVVAGAWKDPWTGEFYRGTARRMQGDHHFVSLYEAHLSGGHAWNYAQRLNFYNDPDNVRALTARANSSKGGADVAEARGRPKDESYWCEFATGVERVKANYRLAIDAKEAAWIARMKETCAGGERGELERARSALELAAQALEQQAEDLRSAARQISKLLPKAEGGEP